MNTRRLSKVDITWSSKLAYAIGLITSDGNLSPDGRHINFTTKDLDLANTYRYRLNLNNKIGMKARGSSLIKQYYVVQFGDKNFYEFLLSIGLMPAKSKVLGRVKIPQGFFSHFVRGCIDGDGSFALDHHPESQHIQLRVKLYAYNPVFLKWIHSELKKNTAIKGGWVARHKSVHVLAFGKEDSIEILHYLYDDLEKLQYLVRKYNSIAIFLGE